MKSVFNFELSPSSDFEPKITKLDIPHQQINKTCKLPHSRNHPDFELRHPSTVALVWRSCLPRRRRCSGLYDLGANPSTWRGLWLAMWPSLASTSHQSIMRRRASRALFADAFPFPVAVLAGAPHLGRRPAQRRRLHDYILSRVVEEEHVMGSCAALLLVGNLQ